MENQNEEKNLLKSKTIWISVLVTASAFFPPVQAILATSPELAGIVVGGVFGVLRAITKGKITLK
jgi:hypothetical protein